MAIRFSKDPRYANRGRDFEELIELSNRQYANRGLATIHKVPTAWKPIRNSSGKVITAKVDKDEFAGVDFLGCYQGRALAFDAKHTNGHRLRWDRVATHQAEFLDAWRNVGGITFILAEFEEQAYVIPWRWWSEQLERWRRKGGRQCPASVAVDELPATWACPRRSTIVCDYLKVVDRIWSTL